MLFLNYKNQMTAHTKITIVLVRTQLNIHGSVGEKPQQFFNEWPSQSLKKIGWANNDPARS